MNETHKTSKIEEKKKVVSSDGVTEFQNNSWAYVLPVPELINAKNTMSPLLMTFHKTLRKESLKKQRKKTHKVHIAFCSLPSNPENSLII